MVTVTKQEAVRTMLRAAFQALWEGDEVCALTLAGAAEEAMPTAAKETAYDAIRASVGASMSVSEKIAGTALNFQRNWLKHHKEGEPVSIDVWMADVMVLRAVSRYTAVYGADDLTQEWARLMMLPKRSD